MGVESSPCSGPAYTWPIGEKSLPLRAGGGAWPGIGRLEGSVDTPRQGNERYTSPPTSGCGAIPAIGGREGAGWVS